MHCHVFRMKDTQNVCLGLTGRESKHDRGTVSQSPSRLCISVFTDHKEKHAFSDVPHPHNIKNVLTVQRRPHTYTSRFSLCVYLLFLHGFSFILIEGRRGGGGEEREWSRGERGGRGCSLVQGKERGGGRGKERGLQPRRKGGETTWKNHPVTTFP